MSLINKSDSIPFCVSSELLAFYENVIKHVIDHSFDLQGGELYIHIFLARPKSTGFVRLKSTNYEDDPIIDPRYLANQHDVDTIVAGKIFGIFGF